MGIKKRPTLGERMAAKYLFNAPEAVRKEMARDIDRQVVRYRASAWKQGQMTGYDGGGLQRNPFVKANS